MGEMLSRMVEVLRLALVAQVGLATVLGGAIGLERELGGKPAGLRTNILICIGSVLYTHLSIAMVGGGADPTRVAVRDRPGAGVVGAYTGAVDLACPAVVRGSVAR